MIVSFFHLIYLTESLKPGSVSLKTTYNPGPPSVGSMGEMRKSFTLHLSATELVVVNEAYVDACRRA